jgi:hypothetical protein
MFNERVVPQIRGIRRRGLSPLANLLFSQANRARRCRRHHGLARSATSASSCFARARMPRRGGYGFADACPGEHSLDGRVFSACEPIGTQKQKNGPLKQALARALLYCAPK